MTQKQLDIYGAYVYNQRCRMEDDISTLQQNLRWRKISVLDCLELIIAQERYNAFCEFVADVNFILKINFQKKGDKMHGELAVYVIIWIVSGFLLGAALSIYENRKEDK